jgi:hypothetical protein
LAAFCEEIIGLVAGDRAAFGEDGEFTWYADAY